eukprot:COSAG06_NODE_6216_length_3045_cov_2.747794_3_plen_262_part_00
MGRKAFSAGIARKIARAATMDKKNFDDTTAMVVRLRGDAGSSRSMPGLCQGAVLSESHATHLGDHHVSHLGGGGGGEGGGGGIGIGGGDDVDHHALSPRSREEDAALIAAQKAAVVAANANRRLEEEAEQATAAAAAALAEADECGLSEIQITPVPAAAAECPGLFRKGRRRSNTTFIPEGATPTTRRGAATAAARLEPEPEPEPLSSAAAKEEEEEEEEEEENLGFVPPAKPQLPHAGPAHVVTGDAVVRAAGAAPPPST